MAFLVRINLVPIVIFSGVLMGLLLPEIGLIWSPYLKELLMLLMLFASLQITWSEFKNCVKLNIRAVLVSLVLIFLFMPLLSLTTSIFSPIILAGTVLAFSCPSAIATVFWSGVFKGNVSLGLIISTVANLLSIVLVPVLMLVTLGTIINLDPVPIVLNLAQLILIPLVVAALLRRFFQNRLDKISAFGSRVSLVIIMFLLWGSVALGARYIEGNVVEFLELNLFILALLALGFSVAYFIGKTFGDKKAITIGIATFHKNAILSFVVGLSVFGSQVFPPLIANIIQQNLLLIPLQTILRRVDQPQKHNAELTNAK